MDVCCGIDEAGRGPLAGPVLAAAVILPPGFPVDLLRDSKKLSEKQRAAVEPLIKAESCWGIAAVDHTVIDSVNILQATFRAMEAAFADLLAKLQCGDTFLDVAVLERIQVIVDGNRLPRIAAPKNPVVVCVARVKADATVPEVMAASILAKCERDRIMCAYARQYPAYGYDRHKGYPTREHRDRCLKLGPSPIQRRSFAY